MMRDFPFRLCQRAFGLPTHTLDAEVARHCLSRGRDLLRKWKARVSFGMTLPKGKLELRTLSRLSCLVPYLAHPAANPVISLPTLSLRIAVYDPATTPSMARRLLEVVAIALITSGDVMMTRQSLGLPRNQTKWSPKLCRQLRS